MTGARDHVVELRFADNVAGAVAGLAKIQELFESDQLALRVGPAARGPAGMEFARFFQRHLVVLDAERGEPARGAIGQHDPNQFAAVRFLVVDSLLHRDLFHGGGETFGTVGIHVEQRALGADRRGLRLVSQPGELDPVEFVAGERERVERVVNTIAFLEFNQPNPQGVADQLSDGVHLELGEDFRPVGLDGFDAEA